MSISKKLKQKNQRAIRVEKFRQKLAEKKNFSKLIKTYKKYYPELSNSNTGKKWDKLNNAIISEQTYPMAFDRVNLISKEIKGSKIRVLDYGFGNGKLEELLWKRSSKNITLYGIDISPKSVQKATKHFPKWSFIKGSKEKLTFNNRYFDFITAMEVLEHINPSQVLSILKIFFRILKDNGKLIVSVPLNEQLEKMLQSGSNPNSHVRIYSPELIVAELKISGFRIIKMKYLYAFHNNYYLKSFITNLFPVFPRKPNNLIIVAEKI